MIGQLRAASGARRGSASLRKRENRREGRTVDRQSQCVRPRTHFDLQIGGTTLWLSPKVRTGKQRVPSNKTYTVARRKLALAILIAMVASAGGEFEHAFGSSTHLLVPSHATILDAPNDSHRSAPISSNLAGQCLYCSLGSSSAAVFTDGARPRAVEETTPGVFPGRTLFWSGLSRQRPDAARAPPNNPFV